MANFLPFCLLAAKRLAGQACGSLGFPIGEAVGHQLAQFLETRFLDQSNRVIDALCKAHDQSWVVTESLLRQDAGGWELCKVFLQPADERSLRAKLESTLDATLRGKQLDPTTWRVRCLRDLQGARAAGLLAEASVDLGQLAKGLSGFGDPLAAREGSTRAVRSIAEALKQAGYPVLASLVAWKPDGKEPLIGFLADYFFRRQIENDETLYRVMTFTTLERIEKQVAALTEHLTHRPIVPAAPSVVAPVPSTFHFSTTELQENPEPRLPCVLLVDTSKSMAGDRLAALRLGLEVYRTELNADNHASQRVEVAVASFGRSVEILSEFVGAEKFTPPALDAGGKTPLGAGIQLAMNMITVRQKQYRECGIGSFKPWLFLLTDGTPTDEWRAAAKRIRAAEAENSLFFYAIGVEDANFEILRELTTRPVYKLDGLRFRDLFRWLSQSQRSVSRSSPGRQALAPPDIAGDWAVRS